VLTGETLLHIAIVQHQLDSIEWLLNHGAHVDSRALGIFFQDSIIPRFVDDLGLLQRHGPKQYRMQTNSQGGTCEYGEFPLSFAASVGDEHICHLICERADHLISLAVDGLKQLAPQVNTAHEDHDFFIEESEVNFLKTELDQVIRRNVENGEGLLEYLDGQLKKHRHSDGVSKEEQFYRDLLRSAFLNRRDSQGNTALHQAVKYRRISTIDWLLNNGAEHSLSILNDEDLTPLTLAVRLGDTTTFEHLVTCQRVNVWRYGTVCMDIMSLEQIDTFRIAPEKKTNDRDPSVFRRFYRTYLLPVWCGGIPREKVPTKVFPSPSKASFKWSSHGKVTSDHYRDVLPYRKLVEDSQPNKYLVRDRERHDGIEHMHSDPFWRSALEVVVENEIDEFIDCDNGSIFQDLVSQKWNSFARGYHIWWELGPFSLFVGLLTCSCFYRVAAIWELHVGPYYNTESDQFVRVLVPTNDPEMYKTIVVWLYGFVFLGGIPYLFYRALIERRLSARDLDPNEDLNLDFVEILFFVYKNLSTTLSFLIAVLLVTQGSLWLLHDDYWDGKDLWAWNIESQLMCFIMLFAWLKVVHMLLPFEGIGRLLITVWRMFMSDIITWLILVIFVLIAFSLATGIIVRSNFIVNRDIIDLEKQSVLAGDMPFMPFDQIMSYISVMLGEVQHPSVTTQGFQTALQRFMHIIYNIIATLLLQNLIIAMMGDTYARERENEGFAMWWMNHASLVLRYERRISRRNRIRHRTGTDLNKGDDFPECRPYFSVTVGPDKQMEDVWNNATRHVSSEELNDNIDAHFQTVKQSFQVCMCLVVAACKYLCAIACNVCSIENFWYLSTERLTLTTRHLQVLLHRLQRTVDVRFKILDAKINTIFKQVFVLFVENFATVLCVCRIAVTYSNLSREGSFRSWSSCCLWRTPSPMDGRC
jgi:ankyrin repeat protein